MENKDAYKQPISIQKEKLELDNDIFAGEDNRRDRPEYFMPPGTEVLKVLDTMEIDLSPKSVHSKSKWPMFFFSIVWNLMVFGFVIAAIYTFSLVLLLFMSSFVAAGLAMTWKTLKIFFNKKKIEIDAHTLHITEGPFKINNQEQKINISDISQLYVNKYFTGTIVNGERIMAYSLSAILKNNKSVRLINDSNLETALYLEQEIERFLDIEDEEVRGEILQ